MSALPRTGLYTTVDGREYQVVREGGWKLMTRDPDSLKRGFRAFGHGRYARAIGPDERLEVVSLRYDGTYQGVPVQIAPNLKGTVVLTTGDRRAKELGFEPIERSDWVLVVEPDARGLVVTPRRTKVPAPWLDDQARRGGNR